VNPAFSVVVFTTVAGAAQGLVVTLALALAPAFLRLPNGIANFRCWHNYKLW
jgi:hypothetical protein